MMNYRSLMLVFLVTLLFACGASSKFSGDEISQQDEAWKTMMEGHDRVMPKMNDLYQANKALEEIAENNMVAADDTHPRAMEAMKMIESAEDGMMDWMASIGENQLAILRERDMDHAALMAFIAKEQVNIDAVEEAMETSLSQAKALIVEKSNN